MKKQQNLSFGIPGEEYVFDGRRIFISRKGVIRLSGDAVVLYQLMDGKTSDRRRIENFNKCRDSRLYPADLRRFVRQLTRKNLLCGRVNGCLASKASPYYQRRMLDAFDKMTVREALYAGIGYKADPTALRKDLKESVIAKGKSYHI